MPHDEGGKMTNAEVAYRASSKGIEERNELVLRELPQVYYVAARIHERLPKHVDMEDLVQAGVIGLLDACRNYDSEQDAQFSTFAKHRIRGAILDSLRKLDWGSRTLRRKGREIATSAAKLESQLGRHPLEEEIAADLKMPIDELQSAGVETADLSAAEPPPRLRDYLWQLRAQAAGHYDAALQAVQGRARVLARHMLVLAAIGRRQIAAGRPPSAEPRLRETFAAWRIARRAAAGK